MDINRLSGVLFNLFPQSPDMYIHSPYIPRVIIAPDDVQKIFSAVYFIRVKNKKLQNIEFLGGKINLPAGDKYSAALAIHLQISHLDRLDRKSVV